MSTNCLVTKLKGTVNNDNLEILGTIVLKTKNTSGTKITISALNGTVAKPVKISVSNGALYPYNSSTELAQPASRGAAKNLPIDISTTSAGKLYIADKYNLTQFTPKDELIDSNYLDLDDFTLCTGLTRFQFGDYGKGTLSKLGKFANLTNVEIMSSNVTGDIKDFVAARVSLGQTTGSVNCVISIAQEMKVTLNGQKIWIGTNGKLKWESATKIYTLDSAVRCIGYTDGEIATNTAEGGIWEGKTVTKFD